MWEWEWREWREWREWVWVVTFLMHSLSLLGGMDTPQSAPAAGLGPVPLLPSGPGPGLAVFMATLVPVPAGQTGACQRTD